MGFLVFIFFLWIGLSIVQESEAKNRCKLHVWKYDSDGYLRCAKCNKRPQDNL